RRRQAVCPCSAPAVTTSPRRRFIRPATAPRCAKRRCPPRASSAVGLLADGCQPREISTARRGRPRGPWAGADRATVRPPFGPVAGLTGSALDPTSPTEMASLEDRILEQLRGLGEPGSGRTLGELDALVRVQASEGRVTVVLRLGEIDPALLAQVRAKVTEISGVQQVNVEIEPESGGSRRPVGADDPVPEVDNVVLVMSGKGGVGKSTVAANLALALARSGHRV